MAERDRGGGEGRRTRGFLHAAGLLAQGIGKAAARRGLPEVRLLTGWAEIAGPDLAAACRPERISHSGSGFGGTLVLTVRAGRGPEVEMMLPSLRDRINTALGYRAVARIRLVQAGPGGLAETAPAFDRTGAPEGTPAAPPPDPARQAALEARLAPLAEEGLRDALAALALNIDRRTRALRPKGSR